MKRLLAFAFFIIAPVAQATSFSTLDLLNQEQFRSVAENVAAATHYKAVTPAEPLGIIGFDVGLSLSNTPLEDEAVFNLASEGDFDVPGLILPRLSAHKGLPFGIDFGASVSAVPSTDITVLGAEVRYAILKGGIALPAVGVRASFSTLSGVDEFDMQSLGLDISVSKGFLLLTPYAGAGIVRTTVTPNDVGTLVEEEFDQTKLFAGININLGLNITLEADRTDDFTSFSAKAGFRF